MPDRAGATDGDDITALLQRWKAGDREALERLAPRVYAELRRIAARSLASERRDHTLQSTALVHEAFLKLVDQRSVDWQSRAHFFGLAAQLMRRILVDHARRVGRVKRGGDTPTVSLEAAGDVADAAWATSADVFLLDAALRKLEAFDPTQGRIVELRFFGGLTIEETAGLLGVSAMTIKRDWAVAKAWLYRELSGTDGR
jgi:RNA polymerase sigma factor (TIGR02999 family)